MENIIDLLKNFSFSTPESQIYLAVLSINKPNVSQIAKKVGMNRTATYFHLKNLLNNGILRAVKKEKTLHFSAITPKDLADRFQQITTNFKSFVPHLEALNKMEREMPAIEVVEAKSGYVKVYDSIGSMPINSIFRVIEGSQSFKDEVNLIGTEGLQSFFSSVVQRKIITKGIFTEETLVVPRASVTPENYNVFKKRLWNIRVLPEEKLPLKNPTLIYGNRVSFLFPEFSLVVTIRHQGVVDIIVAMFDALFEFGERVERPWL